MLESRKSQELLPCWGYAAQNLLYTKNGAEIILTVKANSGTGLFLSLLSVMGLGAGRSKEEGGDFIKKYLGWGSRGSRGGGNRYARPGQG